MLEIGSTFAQVFNFVFLQWQIVNRNHGFYACKCFRLARIYRFDPRMRVWASHNRPVQHARHIDICTVFCPTDDFIHAIVPNRTGTNNFVIRNAQIIFCFCRHYGITSLFGHFRRGILHRANDFVIPCATAQIPR